MLMVDFSRRLWEDMNGILLHEVKLKLLMCFYDAKSNDALLLGLQRQSLSSVMCNVLDVNFVPISYHRYVCISGVCRGKD